MAWKMTPVDLVESLVDGRELRKTELFRIYHNEDPDDEDEPLGVTLYEEEKELTVTPEFFHDVVVEFGGAHLDLVGADHLPWFEDLSPAARALLEIQPS